MVASCHLHGCANHILKPEFLILYLSDGTIGGTLVKGTQDLSVLFCNLPIFL